MERKTAEKWVSKTVLMIDCTIRKHDRVNERKRKAELLSES